MRLPLPAILATTLAFALIGDAVARAPDAGRLVVWAWERPEDLRFLPPDVEIAAQTGFVVLSGDQVLARGRRHGLRARLGQVTTAVVHVELDPRRLPDWPREQRARAADEVALLARRLPVRRVQVDLEVPASRRQIVLDLLHDVRTRLPAGTRLSMTALASWCEGETWLADADVDEITPMLFRMGRDGAVIRARLAQGDDFASPRCRSAVALAADMPLPFAPTTRRIYLFNPNSWTAEAFARARQRIATWQEHVRSPG